MMHVESLTVWWLQYLRGAWKWIEDTTVQGSRREISRKCLPRSACEI